jgi:DNA polymerase elongation subunit (family B)
VALQASLHGSAPRLCKKIKRIKKEMEKFESYEVIVVNSIGEFIEKIEEKIERFDHKGISLFRGQKEDWNLLPKLARKKSPLDHKRKRQN